MSPYGEYLSEYKEKTLRYSLHCGLGIRQLDIYIKKDLENTKVYPKVSGLATWSVNCKWYSSLPLGAIVSLFCESVQ
jgi:hypothetical protein